MWSTEIERNSFGILICNLINKELLKIHFILPECPQCFVSITGRWSDPNIFVIIHSTVFPLFLSVSLILYDMCRSKMASLFALLFAKLLKVFHKFSGFPTGVWGRGDIPHPLRVGVGGVKFWEWEDERDPSKWETLVFCYISISPQFCFY